MTANQHRDGLLTEQSGWWCALPDLPATVDAAALLASAGGVIAWHGSGRPWIIGPADSAVREVLLTDARAAVLGECLASDQRLTAAAGRGIEALMGLPGSFHALLADPRGLIAAGDVAGFRRVFTTRAHGVPVVASHADVLRRMAGAPVDRVWLACRLASPEVPSVVRDTRSPFVGVDPVPAGHRVEITGHGCRIARWWTPPAATRSLAVGVDLLREALTGAVIGRISRDGGPVSVQLSGGLDSTALAALAHPARPLLVTTAGRSPVEDDLAWATRAAGLLPGCKHRVIGADEAPLFFADLDIAVPGMDEPAPFAAGAARQRYAANLLAEHGSVLHLNGQGGDEVLLAPLAYLRPAVAAVPATGWRHLRGHAALHDVRMPAMVRAVARRESFAAWLRRAATTLVTAARVEPPAAERLTGWEAPPVMPPWATTEAARLVASAILAADPTPVVQDQAGHAALVRIRASAYRAGLYRDAMAAAGVPTAMPFFDRAVIEACVSVLPWERTDPWQPKPLLRAALANTVSENLLCRRTKSGYNADILHGWSVHRDQLAALLAAPLLAEYGLIDGDRLRADLAVFAPSGLAPAWVTDLIAVETWLRALDHDHADHAPARLAPAHLGDPDATDVAPALVVGDTSGTLADTLADTVRLTLVDDGATVLDLRRGTLFHVNRAGAVILAALTNPTTGTTTAIEAAVGVLVARYGIPAEQARADVTALLAALRDRGLLARPRQSQPGRPR